MSRCTGIRAIVALEYDPKYYPNTSLPDVNHRANEVGHALRNEDWILAYDLGNELYFWELGAIRVSNNSTTTLHDLYPFDKHAPLPTLIRLCLSLPASNWRWTTSILFIAAELQPSSKG
eukprot:TRINITY_DN10558_c0_g1_i1.p3 TRINITY_DN10558_c0_g1~~TRINITY_DN10558_c0_g1_i1.p3  ORF type:complete len:119 (+),score=24.57 TRINITY_DN10558_c0_g1_i1:707-1063(+)